MVRNTKGHLMSAKTFWRWTRGVSLCVLALGVAAALVVIVGQSPQRGTTFVEVLKLFLGWPAIVAALGFSFGIAFRKELASFIEHIGAIRFAGAEVVRQSPSPPDAAGAGDERPPTPPTDGAITLTADQQKEIRETVDQLFRDFEKATERAGQAETLANQVQEALNTKQQQAIWWWFQFLNLFCVPNTKWVLHWFATRTTQASREWFHEEWKARIPSAKEREIILSVLLHHELLVENGSLLAVSDAGNAFLEFLRQQGLWFPAL